MFVVELNPIFLGSQVSKYSVSGAEYQLMWLVLWKYFKIDEKLCETEEIFWVSLKISRKWEKYVKIEEKSFNSMFIFMLKKHFATHWNNKNKT